VMWVFSSLSFFFLIFLFICVYKAWVISPPCPHPLPYHLTFKLRMISKQPKNKNINLLFLYAAPTFHLAKTTSLIPFPLSYNKTLLFPYYTHVSCLDASMWDTKNLGIFWSETVQSLQ
jgi:hypothetical protein